MATRGNLELREETHLVGELVIVVVPSVVAVGVMLFDLRHQLSLGGRRAVVG